MTDLVQTAMAKQDDLVRGGAMRRVWDPLVRLFHWSLVAGIVIAYESPFRDFALHAFAGYAALGLILFRVLWGVVGTRHARFTDFVHRPSTVFRYMGRIVRGTEARHLGHNPAGGAMVVALILSVTGTALTGWLMYTPAYQYGDDTIPRLHMLAANATLALVIVHLAGVALVSLHQRENLVFSMIHGRKRAPSPGDVD